MSCVAVLWFKKEKKEKGKREKKAPEINATLFFLGYHSLTWLAVKGQLMPETQIDKQKWKEQK